MKIASSSSNTVGCVCLELADYSVKMPWQKSTQGDYDDGSFGSMQQGFMYVSSAMAGTWQAANLPWFCFFRQVPHGNPWGWGNCIQDFVLKPDVLHALQGVGLNSQRQEFKEEGLFWTGQFWALKCCPKGSLISEMQDECKRSNLWEASEWAHHGSAVFFLP